MPGRRPTQASMDQKTLSTLDRDTRLQVRHMYGKAHIQWEAARTIGQKLCDPTSRFKPEQREYLVRQLMKRAREPMLEFYAHLTSSIHHAAVEGLAHYLMSEHVTDENQANKLIKELLLHLSNEHYDVRVAAAEGLENYATEQPDVKSTLFAQYEQMVSAYDMTAVASAEKTAHLILFARGAKHLGEALHEAYSGEVVFIAPEISYFEPMSVIVTPQNVVAFQSYEPLPLKVLAIEYVRTWGDGEAREEFEQVTQFFSAVAKACEKQHPEQAAELHGMLARAPAARLLLE